MRRRSTWFNQGFAAACAVACLLSSEAAGAFTFSDGKPGSCVVDGKKVEEVDADPSQAGGFTGKAVRTDSGYVITWNQARLKALPPDVHDFIFFHECAHALVQTTDEVQANCAGLQGMRAAQRAGPEVETRIAAFYGPGSDFWARTLKCANAAPPVPANR
jgi:hypothetical protein